MGRSRGKFSFPIPGRKSQRKLENDDDASSTPSIPSVHEWPSRLEEPSSKAHRVLGTSEPMYRATSKQSVPASPGYMSITVSEASFNSQNDDKASGTIADYKGYPIRPDISRRPSSNIIGRAYSGDGKRSSDHSAASHQLHPQTSNSTMRSHYDSKSSPLSISQQTSDSAVRDMALRRGKPQVVTDQGYGHTASPVSPVILDEARRKEQRKSKPARLDLSKLFPKPRLGEGNAYSNALLSPTKMVNSPAAMSITSDYHFPRPMTREPTPNPRGQVKLKKTSRQPVSTPHIPSSPVRKFKRDEYDNAKVHVRRPPKGVQHWFDALDEDSDEALENSIAPIYAPKAVRPNAIPKVPVRKTSLGGLAPDAAIRQTPRRFHLSPAGRKDTFSHEDLIDTCLNSPSEVSLQSTRTKESALSKINLQDSSVLSFSSSEDESDGRRQKNHRVAVRKSLDMNDDAGEIIVGQAQAFEVRPHHRRPSALSTRSTSTNAATIEVMYTPEPPFSPFHYPRSSNYNASRRSSHARQPSVIPEDEDVMRPKTAINTPLSPAAHSIRSARTSASEPKPRSEGSRKLMAVTAEEEALLEMMRKKRAAMGKKDINQLEQATEEQERPCQTPTETSQYHYRTSGFLAEASPVRVVEAQATRRALAIGSSPLLLPPRGRPLKAHYDANIGQSHLRDSSASDAWSEHHSSPASRIVIPHQLPTPSEFSPLDPFPPSSPVPTASVATTDHPSPLPSPITPGLRAYEQNVNVKVASSDTSNESEEVSILDTGVIDAPPESVKSSASSHNMSTQHRHRRTASSGADVSFPILPTHSLTDLTPVSEKSSRSPSNIEPPVPKLPRKNSKRISGLALLTNGNSRSRQGSVSSHASSLIEGRSSKRVSRQSSATSIIGNATASAKGKRSSVSDDVLAAWGSLGGTY